MFRKRVGQLRRCSLLCHAHVSARAFESRRAHVRVLCTPPQRQKTGKQDAKGCRPSVHTVFRVACCVRHCSASESKSRNVMCVNLHSARDPNIHVDSLTLDTVVADHFVQCQVFRRTLRGIPAILQLHGVVTCDKPPRTDRA